jgi:predicted flap endonuclease-1-like 5' DNA nuclease
MSYLIQQMWLCLLIAALLGVLVGWWLAKSSYRGKLEDLEESWISKLDDKEKDYSEKLDDASKLAAAATAPSLISRAEQASYEVEEVEGIGKSYGKKLRDIGISTTEQLLNQCCNINGRITVAEQIGIEDFVVQKWASMCDLMRLSGVEGQLSELMVYSGVDSIQDLGQQNAAVLYSKLSTSNNKQHRVKSVPDESSLSLIISQAKSLKTIMQDS